MRYLVLLLPIFLVGCANNNNHHIYSKKSQKYYSKDLGVHDEMRNPLMEDFGRTYGQTNRSIEIPQKFPNQGPYRPPAHEKP